MTTIELLTQFYQAFKMDDIEYARILQARFPEECAELMDLIIQADSKDKFALLVENLTK